MALLNRILSALLALALVLGGLLAAVEIVLALLDQRPSWLIPHRDWTSWLREQTFDAGVVRGILIGLVVLGLLLLIPAWRRGKPGAIALSADEQAASTGVTVSASRRGIERSLAAAARRTDGVSSATAKVGRRSARVQAGTTTRGQGNLQEQVSAAVTDRLTELGLVGRLRPQVTIARKETR